MGTYQQLLNKTGFEIANHNDMLPSLKTYKENYNNRGKYLGFEAVDEFYSMQLGNVTDWSGFPMSGKTQVLMEFLINTSKFYGWKHLIYFPDVGNKTEIIADLLHKLTGKTFDPLKKDSITESEITQELSWILEHFKVLTKKDVKAKLTPFEFWDLAVQMKKEEGLHTASIDSWKDMSHDYNKYGTYAQYLEVVLPYRNEIAETNNIHLHTVIHPKLTEKEGGVRKPPTPYDLKGGSEWFNSGKTMVTVNRTYNDQKMNEVQLMFTKIKPRSVGKVGDATLYFDTDKFVYYEEDGMEKRYGRKKAKAVKEIEPNKHFLEPKEDLTDFNVEEDAPF